MLAAVLLRTPDGVADAAAAADHSLVAHVVAAVPCIVDTVPVTFCYAIEKSDELGVAYEPSGKAEDGNCDSGYLSMQLTATPGLLAQQLDADMTD